MKKTLLIIAGIIILIVAVLAIVIPIINKISIINTALSWTDMAPLPKSANNIIAETKGNSATREFTLSFYASQEDIEEWLSESTGTSDLSPEIDRTTSTDNQEILTYNIKSTSGAQFAQIVYNKTLGQITIRTYWS